MSEREIAVIGTTEVVKPFLALGVSCYETQDPAYVRELLQTLVQADKTGMIFIAESLAEVCLPEIEKIKLRQLPAVFILPEFGSKKQLGLKRMESLLSKAIGKKI